MAYLYLILSLLSSVTIALMLHLYETRRFDRLVVIAANYVCAGTLAFFFSDRLHANGKIVIFGIFIGFFFFITFLLFSHAIKKEGIASAVTFGRLSLAVPVAASILLWGEKPNFLDILSLLVIFFIILSWEGRIGKISPILLALFILFGFVDSSMKYFKIHFTGINDSFFLIFVFYSAMLWSWSYIFITRRNIKRIEVISGFIMGIPNFFSTFFLLKALVSVQAYIVFPFINIGTIILSALLGYILFKEIVIKRKLVLIFLGVLAILILST